LKLVGGASDFRIFYVVCQHFNLKILRNFIRHAGRYQKAASILDAQASVEAVCRNLAGGLQQHSAGRVLFIRLGE